MSASNVDEAAGATTAAADGTSPCCASAIAASGVVKTSAAQSNINPNLQRSSASSAPKPAAILPAPLAGKIMPNLAQQLSALGAAGLSGGGADNNWEAYMSIAQQIFPNLFTTTNPSLMIQQQQQRPASMDPQQQLQRQYNQNNSRSIPPIDQIMSTTAVARALYHPPFSAPGGPNSNKQPHQQLLGVPTSNLPTASAAAAALATGAFPLPSSSAAAQKLEAAPSSYSMGEGIQNTTIAKKNSSLQPLISSEQRRQEPNLTYAAMAPSPATTHVASNSAPSGTNSNNMPMNFFQQQQQQQRFGAIPTSVTHQQLTGPLANAPWPFLGALLSSSSFTAEQMQQNTSVNPFSTEQQQQESCQQENYSSRKRSLQSKGYTSSTDVSSASDDHNTVQREHKKTRKEAACPDSSMTTSISSSATKNLETEQTNSGTTVVNRTGENAASRRHERNAREQHRSQRIAQQIKDLQTILNQSRINFKPTKYSVLKGVKDYIEKLRANVRQLDDETQKLRDVIAYASQVANSSAAQAEGGKAGIPFYIPSPSFHNFSDGGSHQHNQQLQRQVVLPAAAGTDVNSEMSSQQSLALKATSAQNQDDLYRTIFYESQIAMGVASLDGTFIDCNAEFERLSQTPKAEILTQSLFHFIKSSDMASLFKSMGQMLKSCADSNNDTKVCEEQHSLIWSGTTYLRRSASSTNNNSENSTSDVQLLLSISLTKSSTGSPIFFHCILSPILASYMTG
jgi:hypothetical protein